ncbi:MAG TPA: iron-sulfur cluster assembly protein [Tepidisphaeraceae bacterium]|nr:iron-sulfur cluster assembly protein [Tepidisphaeraceae bacterium]
MSIELTAMAAQEIRQLLSEQPEGGNGLCLQVGIKGLGPQRNFTLELTESGAEHPVIAESQGIRISCREADRPRLDGVKIDFRHVGAVRGFIFQSPSHETSVTDRKPDAGQATPDEEQVRLALHDVIDPEIGINIVDLGLVYGIGIDGRRVQITMTMTTPACPVSEQIKRDINTRLFERCPGLERVEFAVVWDPPWDPEKMSQVAKQALGWSR